MSGIIFKLVNVHIYHSLYTETMILAPEIWIYILYALKNLSLDLVLIMHQKLVFK